MDCRLLKMLHPQSQPSPAGAEMFQEKQMMLSPGENSNVDVSSKHICEIQWEHSNTENPLHKVPRNPLFGHLTAHRTYCHFHVVTENRGGLSLLFSTDKENTPEHQFFWWSWFWPSVPWLARSPARFDLKYGFPSSFDRVGGMCLLIF